MDQTCMTPPRSPTFFRAVGEGEYMDIGYEDENAEKDEFSPWFCCSGQYNPHDKNVNAQGYIGSGEFSNLLHKRELSHFHRRKFLLLYGFTFATEDAFITQHDLFVNFTIQMYNELECYANDVPLFRTSCVDACGKRTEICKTLSYLRNFCSNYTKHFHSTEVNQRFCHAFNSIVNSLSSLAFSVRDLPSHVLENCSTDLKSASSNLYHVHWDVRWSLIVMLAIVNTSDMTRLSNEFRESCQLHLEKLLRRTAEDLLYIAYSKFRLVKPHEWSVCSPFPCLCIRELWVMLYHLSRQALASKSFWKWMNPIMDLIGPRNKDPESAETFDESRVPDFEKRDPFLVIWVNSHLGKLDYILENESLVREVEANYGFVISYVRMSLQSNVKEVHLRGLLECLFPLPVSWGPSFRLCTELWDFFSKRMNENFINPETPFEAPTSLCKSAVSWCELLTLHLEAGKPAPSKLTSFFLFLHLLGRNCEKMFSAEPKNDWRSLKSRLYLKMSSFKDTTFNTTGFFHVVSVLLMLALTTDPNEAWEKFRDLLEESLERNLTHSKDMAIMSAHVAFFLVFVKREVSCSHVANSLSCRVSRLSRATRESDKKIQSELSELGQIFAEGFAEIVSSSTKLSLGQFQIIDDGMTLFLNHFGHSERNSLLEAMEHLVNRIRKDPMGDEDIYDRISSHVVNNLNPRLLETSGCGLIAQLTMYLLENLRAEAKSFIHNYALRNDNFNPRWTCSYLSLLLDEPKFSQALTATYGNHQKFLIQVWFRIAISLQTSTSPSLNTDMQKLESSVKTLPQMNELFHKSQSVGVTQDSDSLLQDFLRAIGTVQSNAQTLNERIEWKELALQYFGPLDKYTTNYCKTWEPFTEVQELYRSLAWMFFYCPTIIYSKGKPDCLMAMILSQFLLPRSFFDLSQPLPGPVSAGLQQNLHLFVRGLASLNPSSDSFVSRCLKEIFAIYLPRFTVSKSHPLTRCCISSDRDSSNQSRQVSSNIQNYFLQVLMENVINRRGDKITANVVLALNWVKLIVTLDPQWRVEVSRKLLPGLLSFLLALDEQSPARRVSVDLIQYLMLVDRSSHPELSELIDTALADVVQKNLAFNAARLFKLLDVLVLLNSNSVKRSIPLIEKLVGETEIKRGTGNDATLRRYLDNLKSSLSFGLSTA